MIGLEATSEAGTPGFAFAQRTDDSDVRVLAAVAADSVGNASDVLRSDALVYANDVRPPGPPVVAARQRDATTLAVYLAAPARDDREVAGYQWALGAQAGGSGFRPFPTDGTTDFVFDTLPSAGTTVTDLRELPVALVDLSQTTRSGEDDAFVSVRAVDAAGNASQPVSARIGTPPIGFTATVELRVDRVAPQTEQSRSMPDNSVAYFYHGQAQNVAVRLRVTPQTTFDPIVSARVEMLVGGTSVGEVIGRASANDLVVAEGRVQNFRWGTTYVRRHSHLSSRQQSEYRITVRTQGGLERTVTTAARRLPSRTTGGWQQVEAFGLPFEPGDDAPTVPAAPQLTLSGLTDGFAVTIGSITTTLAQDTDANLDVALRVPGSDDRLVDWTPVDTQPDGSASFAFPDLDTTGALEVLARARTADFRTSATARAEFTVERTPPTVSIGSAKVSVEETSLAQSTAPKAMPYGSADPLLGRPRRYGSFTLSTGTTAAVDPLPIALDLTLNASDAQAGLDRLRYVYSTSADAAQVFADSAAAEVEMSGDAESIQLNLKRPSQQPIFVHAVAFDGVGNASDTLSFGPYAPEGAGFAAPLVIARQGALWNVNVYLLSALAGADGYQWALGTSAGATDLRAFPTDGQPDFSFTDEERAAIAQRAGQTVGDLEVLPSRAFDLTGSGMLSEGDALFLSVRAIGSNGATSPPTYVKARVPPQGVAVEAMWQQRRSRLHPGYEKFGNSITTKVTPLGRAPDAVAVSLYRGGALVGTGTTIHNNSATKWGLTRSGDYVLRVETTSDGLTIRKDHPFSINRSAMPNSNRAWQWHTVVNSTGETDGPLVLPSPDLTLVGVTGETNWARDAWSIRVADPLPGATLETAISQGDETLVDWTPAPATTDTPSGKALEAPAFDFVEGETYTISVRYALASIGETGPASTVDVRIDTASPDLTIATATAGATAAQNEAVASPYGDATTTAGAPAALSGQFTAQSFDTPESTPSLTLTVQASDAASGVARIRYATSDSDDADAAFEASAAIADVSGVDETISLTADLPSTTPPTHVHAQAIDAAGNVSTIQTASIQAGGSELGAPSVAVRKATLGAQATVYFLGTTAGSPAGYQWALGTSAGAADLRAWPSGDAVDFGPLTEAQRATLTESVTSATTLGTLEGQPSFDVALPQMKSQQAWYLSVRAVGVTGRYGPATYASGKQPAPPPFEVTFTLPTSGNQWWYEQKLITTVTGNSINGERFNVTCASGFSGSTINKTFEPRVRETGICSRWGNGKLPDGPKTFEITVQALKYRNRRYTTVSQKSWSATITGRTLTVEPLD